MDTFKPKRKNRRMRKFILLLECLIMLPVLFFGYSNEVINFYITELKSESNIIYGK